MFLYTALGDSITAGVGATSPLRTYPSLIVSRLQKGPDRCVGEVLANHGWTCKALEMAVFENPHVYLQTASVITIWVGGDDLGEAALALLHGAPKQVIERALAQYGRDIASLIGGIRRVTQAPIILCTQYNPFPSSPIATQAIAGLNSVTAKVAARLRTGIAPAHAWFAGRQAELISGYTGGRIEDVLKFGYSPVHPNDQGHQVIAQGLMGLIRKG